MIVAGIDPSLTSAGIAVLRDGSPILLRSIGFPSHDGASYTDRGRRIVAQARHIMASLLPGGTPDLVVLEGPAYHAAYGHAFDRAGLWWGVFTALRAKLVPVAVMPPTTLKQWATGKGNADKPIVLAVVRSWWPDVKITNHDIADACVLAAAGTLRLDGPVPFEPKPRHRDLLIDRISWPERLWTASRH